nr:MAG TPA: hypothetical protein [Caudoviricetes sp.]
MITYNEKLLTLRKATRAPYKRTPASELSFCCRSGRANAREPAVIKYSLVVFSC